MRKKKEPQKAKDKLVKFCGAKIIRVFDGALSYIEVLLDENQYKKVRSRILRIGNNAIRELEQEITDHYEVSYDSKIVDVIKVREGKDEKEITGDKKEV